MVTVSQRRYKSDCGLNQSGESDIISQFWQEWLEYRDKLYSCCLKLMNFNQQEAEDALSQAQIKAWEKVQEFGENIRNLKAWLMQLTRNLCLDIIAERERGPVGVEDIELVGDKGVLCTVSSVPSPEMVLEREEKSRQIRRAVASLRQRLRDTFVLHFYEGLNHREIAERQGISYDNVCKRISLARKQLETMLRGYFRDEEHLATAIESGRKKSLRPVAQTETAGKDCTVVVEAKLDLKDGAVEDLTRVDEKMVEKARVTATETAGKDCTVVVEAKPELVSGAVARLAQVGSQMQEVYTQGSGSKSWLTPSAASACVSGVVSLKDIVWEKGSDVGREMGTVSALQKCVSVAAGKNGS